METHGIVINDGNIIEVKDQCKELSKTDLNYLLTNIKSNLFDKGISIANKTDKSIIILLTIIENQGYKV